MNDQTLERTFLLFFLNEYTIIDYTVAERKLMYNSAEIGCWGGDLDLSLSLYVLL